MNNKPKNRGEVKSTRHNSVNMEISSRYERTGVILSSVFIWGILAHGFMIFNKFSFHDDIAVFYGISELDAGIAQGRWMCSVYGYLLSKFYGSDLSLPLFKGLVSFLFIAVSWIILSDLLELKNKMGLFAISGVLVTVSSVTSIFAYIYMALYYMFAFILSICGGALISRGKNWKENAGGIILLLLAIGTYQMFFVTGICTIVIYMIKKVAEESYEDFRQYLLDGIKYVIKVSISIALYVLITKVLSAVSGIPLSSYKNIDKLGVVSISEYMKRIGMSYGAFFNPNKYVSDMPYPNICLTLYHLILLVLIMVSAVFLYCMFRKGRKTEAAEFAILLFIFPLAANFIFVLAGEAGAIQYYGHILVYVLLLVIMEKCQFDRIAVQKVLSMGIFLILVFLNIAFCRLSNACYLKINLLQEHAISYFETLNARIQMTEGYTADTAVAFIEPRNKRNLEYMDIEMAGIRLRPYNEQSIVNDYKWLQFARIWCGYFSKVANEESYSKLPEVEAMPCYPDDGSIKMIDGVVIVKFNDTLEKTQGEYK